MIPTLIRYMSCRAHLRIFNLNFTTKIHDNFLMDWHCKMPILYPDYTSIQCKWYLPIHFIVILIIMSMYILFKNSRFRNTYIKFPQKNIMFQSVRWVYNANIILRQRNWQIIFSVGKLLKYIKVFSLNLYMHEELWVIKNYEMLKDSKPQKYLFMPD